MPFPNALIFVDLPSDDPDATGRFYAEVFGWQDDARLGGLYHRLVPGGQFLRPDGTESEVGNLRIGVYNAANARPHPASQGAEPRNLSEGRRPRMWIRVSEDDSVARILTAAEKRGATILWRDHYWSEFGGYSYGFRDPWGNEIVLWVKAPPNAQPPQGFTRE